MLYRYFRAEVNEEGEVSGDVCEVNFVEERDRIREQIQEDVMTYVNPLLDNDYEFTNLNVDDLCQIVVDNFKGFE
jgi:hypothetical protein